MAIEWRSVWENVAQAVQTHIAAGREHLLTEDVLRFATALELQKAGVEPKRILPEYSAPKGMELRIGGEGNAEGELASAWEEFCV